MIRFSIYFALGLFVLDPEARAGIDVKLLQARIDRGICVAEKAIPETLQEACGDPKACGSAADNSFNQACSNRFFACMQQHNNDVTIINNYNAFVDKCQADDKNAMKQITPATRNASSSNPLDKPSTPSAEKLETILRSAPDREAAAVSRNTLKAQTDGVVAKKFVEETEATLKEQRDKLNRDLAQQEANKRRIAAEAAAEARKAQIERQSRQQQSCPYVAHPEKEGCSSAQGCSDTANTCWW
jgi:hypothetical protein